MSADSKYALGYSAREHDRLERQARRWRGHTEALFRQAGIREGMRVLDLGSGIGDVAMLIADIAGTSGEVVGIEPDVNSVERARNRVSEARLANVRFVASDVAGIAESEQFDAAAGRFVLQFIPDPVDALRSLTRHVKRQGVVVFQEVAWAPSLGAMAQLPLWSACARTAHEAIKRAGARPDGGLELRRTFLDAGLPEPELKIDMLASIRSRSTAAVNDAHLGDLETGVDPVSWTPSASRRRVHAWHANLTVEPTRLSSGSTSSKSPARADVSMNWLKQADVDQGRRKDGLSTAEREELSKLRKEIKQLKIEREILGKAAAWFARETNSIPPKSSNS